MTWHADRRILPLGLLGLALPHGGVDLRAGRNWWCGGSTAGGIKVNRIVFAVQLLVSEVHRVIRPIESTPFGWSPSPSQPRQAVLAFLLMYILLLGLGTIVLQTAEHGSDHGDVQPVDRRAVHADKYWTWAGRVGPGLFGRNDLKIGMVVLMAMGRLEIMGLIALLTPDSGGKLRRIQPVNLEWGLCLFTTFPSSPT